MIEDLVMECEEAPADVAAGIAAIGGLGSAVEDALVPIMAGVGKVSVGEARLVRIWTRRFVDWSRLQLWSWLGV